MWNRIRQLLALACSLAASASAQDYPHLTIRQIQEVPDALLAVGRDSSSYAGDTVYVRGVVATAPRMADGRPQWFTGTRWRFVLTDPTESIFNSITVVAEDSAYFNTIFLDQLAVGDSIELLGRVTEYRPPPSLTQFEPLRVDTALQVFGPVAYTPTPTVLPITAFFEGPTRKLIPAEYYESGFVRLENVTVIGVSNLPTREWIVADSSGNIMTIDDQSVGIRDDSNPTLSYDMPAVNSLIGFVQGFIFNAGDSRFTLNPRNANDIKVLEAKPSITELTRLDSLPGPGTNVRLRARIIDEDGKVMSASVVYAVNGGPIQSLPMSAGPDSVWGVSLPAVGVDSALVAYYYTAADDSGNVVANPIDTVTSRHFYLSLNRAPGIRDIQFTPYGGASSYDRIRLSVEGIATSTRRDFTNRSGFSGVFIQDGVGEWSGIFVFTADTTVQRGDLVQVTGFVREDFGRTVLDTTMVTIVSNDNPIPSPTTVLADQVMTGGLLAEPLESVLLQLENVFVVNLNEDSPSNFGEFGIHEDLGRTRGLRVDDLSVNLPYANDTSLSIGRGKIQLHTGDYFASMRGILDYSFSNYKLVPRDSADFSGYTEVTSVETVAGELPMRFTLGQNYPNPFNPSTTLEYALPRASKVRLAIYNLLGQEVAVLVDDVQTAGTYRVRIDSQVLSGAASGIYFYNLTAGDFTMTKKMLLIR